MEAVVVNGNMQNRMHQCLLLMVNMAKNLWMMMNNYGNVDDHFHFDNVHYYEYDHEVYVVVELMMMNQY